MMGVLGAILLTAVLGYDLPFDIPPPPARPVRLASTPTLAPTRPLPTIAVADSIGTVDPDAGRLGRIETKLDGLRTDVTRLTAVIEARKDQMDEDHVTIAHPNTGLTVRLARAESSLGRHSWLLYSVAGVVGTIAGGVGIAVWKKRLGLNGKKVV